MKRKLFLNLIAILLVPISIILFQSCGKDDEVLPPPPPTDTLSAGWQKIYVDTSTFIIDISFPTQQIGYVCGNRYLGKSIDGGLTWTKFNFPDSLNGQFSYLFFINQNTGWATTANFVLRTTDGGASWKKTILDRPTDIQFVTQNIGYVATGNGLFKSIDGGASFQKIPAAGSNEIYGVFFFDENNGWISGFPHFIQSTQNGGSSFDKRTDFAEGTYYNIQFTDANHGWLTGSQTNYIRFTKNAGVSWEQIGNFANQNDAHFFNANDGYVSNTFAIYRTADGGTTLTREVYSAASEMLEMCFTDPNHGWATAGGYIYRYSK